LLGRVPLVVDGGDLEHGLESTVVDVRGEIPILLRPGALTVEVLELALGGAVRTASPEDVARSPGTKYRHYSPRAEIWLYPAPISPSTALRCQLDADALELRSSGRRVGAISERAAPVDHFIARPLDPKELGRRLFGWLRELDELGVDCILVEGVTPTGVGRAVMDRLERAATRVRGVAVHDDRGPDR
jgi:L-threonylcarbamoyladenylate synthase